LIAQTGNSLTKSVVCLWNHLATVKVRKFQGSSLMDVQATGWIH
jgi:hypothetical protein